MSFHYVLPLAYCVHCIVSFVGHFSLLFSSESRSPRREPVHGGRTPSAPLSATSHRLLTEFGLRYGVVGVAVNNQHVFLHVVDVLYCIFLYCLLHKIL